jgi:rhodanese-related sulfurtransferase
MPQIIISRDELQQRVNEGAHLIEVLPAKEFSRAHLPRAINIRWQS